MKIIRLQASNIKKLSAINIAPDGNVVTLAGDNGAGKSSVLDAIAYALGGTSGVCAQPIRRGESEAEIVCQLDGLTVTRRFNAGGSILKVEDADGKRQSSPQAILDKLVGNLAFDPLEFARKKESEQAETLRRLVGIDFNTLDAEKVRVYNERLIVGREVDVLKGKLAGVTITGTVPTEEISVEELSQKLKAAQALNLDNAGKRSQHQQCVNAVENARRERHEIFVEISRLQELLKVKEANFSDRAAEEQKSKAVIDTLVDADCTPLHKQLTVADATNSGIRIARAHEAQTNDCKAKSAIYDTATARIAEIDEEKKRLLASAKFPLPELGFSESGRVTYNSFPFAQASDGEKLRVSVAIGMALNPKLRVIFIRDGSLLDTNGLKVVAELASAHDYQVWLEDARSSDPTAVIIEDGHIGN